MDDESSNHADDSRHPADMETDMTSVGGDGVMSPLNSEPSHAETGADGQPLLDGTNSELGADAKTKKRTRRQVPLGQYCYLYLDHHYCDQKSS